MNELPRYELVFNPEEMEGVYGISLVADPAIQIEAVRFSRTICDCKFSDEDVPNEVIDNIISKGEKVDLNEWELIDEKAVDNDLVYSIDLANVVPNNENEVSEQDNEIFRVRYEYTPSSTSAKSRDFCVKMASAGLQYRKEDLVNSNANPGFGPGGISNYNIFLYKGGVNCKHFFSRKIYLRKGNKKLTVFEALKYIGNLDKETAKKAKLADNPTEVGQVASSDNNYWKLSAEITDFKCSNEEKRILTSPVLIPEQNIYREFNGEKCNVFLTAETIEQLQQNFFKNNYQANSTLEHLEPIEGVFFFESWIVKNPDNDKSKELGFSVPSGTWMASMKVENKEIWNEYVKTGLITGFSIDSRLAVVKPQNSKKNNNVKMNYSKVKEAVMKILMEAENKEFKISDELSVFAQALEKDMVVFDNSNAPFANQEFQLDGKIYKTDENGIITEINEVKPEDEAPVDLADVTAPETSSEPSENVEQMKADLETANKKIEELEVENQSLKAELVSIKEEAIQLAKQPSIEGINLNRIEVEDKKTKTTLEVIREVLKK